MLLAGLVLQKDSNYGHHCRVREHCPVSTTQRMLHPQSFMGGVRRDAFPPKVGGRLGTIAWVYSMDASSVQSQAIVRSRRVPPSETLTNRKSSSLVTTIEVQWSPLRSAQGHTRVIDDSGVVFGKRLGQHRFRSTRRQRPTRQWRRHGGCKQGDMRRLADRWIPIWRMAVGLAQTSMPSDRSQVLFRFLKAKWAPPGACPTTTVIGHNSCSTKRR